MFCMRFSTEILFSTKDLFRFDKSFETHCGKTVPNWNAGSLHSASGV
jgi:hypothetical protein